MVEGMCCPEVGEALEYVERYSPFAGSWIAGYAEGIRTADVFDDDVSVGEGDVVSRDDDVVDAD
jgi:hypothetical protein